MSDATRQMSAKEFRHQGFLQELNRRFLHPLGMALVVVGEEDGTERFSGVLDYREDPEGIIFAASECDDLYHQNAEMVEKMIEAREPMRRDALGYNVQPARCDALKPRAT